MTVLVIGGVNVDITGCSQNGLKKFDSIPGLVNINCGGVARNIAENLSRCGVDVKFVTLIADDHWGDMIRRDCEANGIELHAQVVPNATSSLYMCLLDRDDMAYAVSSMDIFNNKLVISKDICKMINEADVVVFDTNLQEATINELVKLGNGKPFFVDTVSTTKAIKLKQCLNSIHTIKPNKHEAEQLFGIKFNCAHDYFVCMDHFLSKGVKNVFISNSYEGVYYADETHRDFIEAPRNFKVVNTTGAGDSFVAVLVLSYLNKYDIELSTKLAMSASILTMSDEYSVCRSLSKEKLFETLEIYFGG